MTTFLLRALTALTSFLSALWRALLAELRREPVVLDARSAVVLRRREICSGCEHRIPVASSLGRCRKCECFIAGKSRLATERCPIKQW